MTDNLNLTLLTDFYELSMANGFFKNGAQNKIACFDVFFRRIPDGGGFAIMAGLNKVIEYLENLHFGKEEIDYLRSKGCFDEEFISYLENFEFTCDVSAIPEGTPIFPKEPILTVCGPIIQAQLVETMILLCINHQSLIATKANRIVRAAQDRTVMEFGARRAQGTDAAISGSRAAFIGGCVGTSCTYSDMTMGIPAMGTMAHSWIQSFDSEYEAFCAYAKVYPDNCSLLVDTYNTVKSGVPNAIRCFNDVLSPMGCRPKSIRIDSGDIAYLSKKARRMLDEAGYPDCKIIASNSLDEYIIRDLLIEGAKIDIFGVGERLICAKSDPMFGGVYKLGAVIEDDGTVTPKVKISDNVGKITLPGIKTTWRLFDKQSGKAIADVITLADETIDESKPYELFDPEHTWKRKNAENFVARRLLVPIFEKGKKVYNNPPVEEIRSYCESQMETIWSEVLRFENPHAYYVDLSQKLWDLRQEQISLHTRGGKSK